MKTFIAFIGTHGSGKTTCLIDLFESIEGKPIGDCRDGNMTVGETCIAFGKYERGKTCGGDTVIMKTARKYFLTEKIEKDVFLYDSVMAFSMNQFQVYRILHKRGIKVIIVYLKISVLGARNRIMNRNGGKPIGNGYEKKKYYYDNGIRKFKKYFPEFEYHFVDVEKENVKETLKKIWKRYK